ncbi:DUF5069 domain-containing protein [Candidatus Poribacteria bacterium]|nr:DUF5069 domain-containing protein [Candidatus Poribacteria bacterium]
MKKNTFRPRSIVDKEVAGIRGVARMADKARATHQDCIGKYKYGVDSQQDTRILSFLGITPDTFKEAAVRLNNDVRLGAWVLDNCNKTDKQIATFNQQLIEWWRSKSSRNYFSKRRREIAREDSDHSFWDWFWLWWLIFFD